MIESGYTGFAYGEVTQDSIKEKGQHIGGLVSRTAGGLEFHNDLRPNTAEIGFSAHFHQDREYTQKQINVLTDNLKERFVNAGAVITGEPVILQREDNRHNDEHVLSITFYSDALQKTVFEAGITDVDTAGRNKKIEMPDPGISQARADGKSWTDASSDRSGHKLGR